MHSYDTVTEALRDLKARGFATDFNLAFDQIKCADSGICLAPTQFEIVEHFRFEGESDPGDEATVYAIAAKDESIKGVLVTAYGMYSESISDDLLQKLRVQQ